MCDVSTHPCLNLIGDVTKPTLKLGHRWVIQPIHVNANTYQCLVPIVWLSLSLWVKDDIDHWSNILPSEHISSFNVGISLLDVSFTPMHGLCRLRFKYSPCQNGPWTQQTVSAISSHLSTRLPLVSAVVLYLSGTEPCVSGACFDDKGTQTHVAFSLLALHRILCASMARLASQPW